MPKSEMQKAFQKRYENKRPRVTFLQLDRVTRAVRKAEKKLLYLEWLKEQQALYDHKSDGYEDGWMDGYNASNKMWQEKTKRGEK